MKEDFDTVRNFLLQNSTAILQDDSGIPVHFFSPDRVDAEVFRHLHWTD